MWTGDLRNKRAPSFICSICGRDVIGTGHGIGICPDCFRQNWMASKKKIESLHAASRHRFELPVTPYRDNNGLHCTLCVHECGLSEDHLGFCGVRVGSRSSFRLDGRRRALVSWYYDPLPTNCVADWVCAGGTGAGYPVFACDRGPEVGYYNLAVFFESCNFNCLFCQNWSFKRTNRERGVWRSVSDLVSAVNSKTTCVCFFGGDPTPQLPYALRVAQEIETRYPDRVLRICWETNGSMNPAWLTPMAKLSLRSGGCVKVDLKAWDSRLHEVLCGCGNHRVLKNFQRLAGWSKLRPDPPFLIASTLLVPGYVGREEVSKLAAFIASLDPDIPYSLLGFAPQFMLEDFPTTSRIEAEACLEVARKAGLRRVRLANCHLLH